MSASLERRGESAERSPRFELRETTAEAHARLDAIYSSFDLGRSDDYGQFLLSHAVAFLPVEEALAAAGAERLVPGWGARRRSDGLRADLVALELPVPGAAIAPEFPNDAALIGGLYVLEGSRLGAAVLRRSVPDAAPKSFLSVGNPTDWRAFTALMDERLSSRGDLEAARTSALAVFGVFERSAQATLGADRP